MTRQNFANVRRLNSRWQFLCGALIGSAILVSHVHAVGLTYVDADDLIPNISPASALNAAGGTPVNDDMRWHIRTTFGSASSIWESGVNEDSPALTQSVTGLAPGTSYDLYGVFWSDKDENWTMQAGLSAGSMTVYSFAGEKGNPSVPASTKAITAGAAVWDVPPTANPEGTVFTQRPADLLVMLLAKAGTAVANGSGQIDVLVDDRGVVGATSRTWFDGVAYVNAGTTIALTAAINRQSGVLTIANPTAQPFQIKGVTLDSPAGALSTTGWTPISGRLDGNGNDSFDTDNWIVTPPTTTPFATQLAEAEDPGALTPGGTLTAGGGSLSLGSIWAKSPSEDVRLSLTLADNSIVLISPTFTGTPIVAGDFDGNGSINLADFTALKTNLHTNASALTVPGAFARGDMNGDRLINFTDFRSFRDAYNAANGPGSFEAIAGVPEPASLGLLALAGTFILRASRRLRRHAAACSVGVAAMALANVSHAQLLKVDVDDREMAQRDLTDVGNTQSGFESFQLDGTGTTGNWPAQTAPTTRALAGYSVTIGPFDDGLDENNVTEGIQNTVGGMDDRDRAVPTDAGALTFSQIYDDLIFAPGSTGPTGGFNVTVSGGALLPNKSYLVSIYCFDTGGTLTRTADWFDLTDVASPILSTSFVNTALPTTNDAYKFSGIAKTDATGALMLRGRNTTGYTTAGGVQPGVHLNGFEIAEAVELSLEINTTTGATRFVNQQNVSFTANYFEIRSVAGALNPSGWTSLDDGEGSDPDGTGWDEAGGSTANILSEVNLTGSRTFAAGQSASLGLAFTPGGAMDVRFFYAAPDGALRPGLVNYITGGGVVGDFNNDGTVNAADLGEWRNDFGPTGGSDADNDGDSDGNDFLIWQRRLGATSVTPSASAVPEPSALALMALVGGALAGSLRRRR